MPMIEQECPHCGESVEFSELYLGRKRSCPNCGKKMPVGEIKEEAKSIPWKRIIPGIVAGLIIVSVLAVQAKRIIPQYRDPGGAHLRCMHCDSVLAGLKVPAILPAKCPRCGLRDIYQCNERCTQCRRIHFFGHGRVVNNCLFCGSTEFTPLPATEAHDAPPPKTPDA